VLSALGRLASRRATSPLRQLLVVDDDPYVCEMIRQLLEGMPYEIASAVDGRLALETIQQKAPDAILLDLLMPELDGFSLIAALRESPHWKDIPIIVLTAKSLSAAERELLQNSVSRVIEKNGLESTALLDEIQRVLFPQG
jgi:CheY-like chemotaxis protein